MADHADTAAQAAVVREIHIEASPEIVFDYFTDPEKMTRWKGRSAELDPRPGGVYHVTMNDVAAARGSYVELDRPHRLVFTWGWEGGHPVAPGSSTVEVTLTPDAGGTLLRLVHTGLPDDQREQHGEGWDLYMPRLAAAAAGRDPGPDPHANPPQP
ncbi:MAG: SRPBCC domain-containing protein [Actinomycetota bacterium]|nr:SRPBCC domain-containing protein [Actinomycetota bacterium]